MPKRVFGWSLLLAFAALVVYSTGLASGEKATSKITLKYKVVMKNEKAGWAKTVVKNRPEGKWLTITSKIQTKFMGIQVKMSSKSFVKYNTKQRATYFDICHENPTKKIRVKGKRSGYGYDIERTKGDKTEKIRIKDASYDLVSVEPALWSGPVGSEKKVRVLFAGQGKVGKAAISIISRKKKYVLGRDTMVTHFKIKSTYGSVEEWRLEDGIITKSKITTPIGKIYIKLQSQ